MRRAHCGAPALAKLAASRAEYFIGRRAPDPGILRARSRPRGTTWDILSSTSTPGPGDMTVRFGNPLILLMLFALALCPARAPQAGPLGEALAPVTEALGEAVCIDPWRKTRPCRLSMNLLSGAARQADQANRWLLSLWSAAGEVVAAPRLFLSGRRVSCDGGRDGASLLALDFTRFQLNMDIDMDTEEDRLDGVRLAYRSCWR